MRVKAEPGVSAAAGPGAQSQTVRHIRWRAIGMNVHGVIAIVFVALGLEAISVISMRPASKQERKLYAEHKEGL
jgi:uncharacterized DUF497 family protein